MTTRANAESVGGRGEAHSERAAVWRLPIRALCPRSWIAAAKSHPSHDIGEDWMSSGCASIDAVNAANAALGHSCFHSQPPVTVALEPSTSAGLRRRVWQPVDRRG
jgi:hypothetical protein